MSEFVLPTTLLSSSVPWLAQIIIILAIAYAVARMLIDARDKKYEDRVKIRDDEISRLTRENEIQLTEMSRQIGSLQSQVNQLQTKLDKEFERRSEAENKIIELERNRQSTDREYIGVLSTNKDLLSENRELRIELEHYKYSHGEK